MRTQTLNLAPSNAEQFQQSGILSSIEIDGLIIKLAKGHLSTMQEEYADLKKVLRVCQHRKVISGAYLSFDPCQEIYNLSD
jgi:hypothetical protein